MAEHTSDIDELGFDELKMLLVQVLEENARLTREIQALRDDNARLKGLNGRPDIKPSGMEKKARARSGEKGGDPSPRRRGPKNDKLAIDETKILKPDNVPAGSKFKGYEDYVVQDLILRPWTVRYRRQRWETPDGRTIVAELPPLGECRHSPAGQWTASAAISAPASPASCWRNITSAG